MRLHVVTTEFPPFFGGVGTWAGVVAAALAGADHEVHVWAHHGAPIAGVTFHRLWGRSWNRWGGVWVAAQVRPWLADDDVVVCTTWPLATHLGPRRSLCVAWHGSDLTRPAVVAGRERVAAQADNLVVSNYLGERLGAPSTWMPYPIEPVEAAPRGEALLTIARLVQSKGVDRVLRLGARLGRPVVVVGDGPERPALERLAVELGVGARFCGATRDIPWAGTWALALFSRPYPDGSGAEGLGLVLLEAAARGLPTLGTRVGGIPEAAHVILDDPDTDDVPALPDAAEVHARLAARHGTAHFLAAFSAARTAGPAARR